MGGIPHRRRFYVVFSTPIDDATLNVFATCAALSPKCACCNSYSLIPPPPLQLHRPPLAVLHRRQLVHRCRPRRLGVQSQAISRHCHRVAPLPALQDFASTQQLHAEACIYRRRFQKRRSHSEPCPVLWLSWLPPSARRHRPPSLLYLPALPHS